MSKTTAAERHWIVEKTAELSQPVYFRDVLTSEWKSGNVLHWGRGYIFISTGNEKLQIPSKLIKIRFYQGDLLKILTTNIKKETKKNYNYKSNICADPPTIGTALRLDETWCRSLMTYY